MSHFPTSRTPSFFSLSAPRSLRELLEGIRRGSFLFHFFCKSNFEKNNHRSSSLFNSSFHPTHTTPTRANSSAVHSSSFLFETPHKASAPPVPSSQIATSRARPCPTVATTKLRPKSLFVTPTVLNDTDALSRLRQNQSPTYDLSMHTPSSSSTICDAESILTTSSSSSTPSTTPLYQKHGKRMTFHHSLPALNLPQTIGEATITAAQRQDAFNNDESGPELDQISDLTSKMFSSEEEDDDVGIGISDDSITSSSTVPSVAEQLI